jgi:hypothetical protein
MRPPRRRGGDPAKAAPTLANNAPKRPAKSSGEPPPIWATAYPPAGHRHRWLLLVRTCDTCGGAHHHFGGPTGGLRRRGCGAGEYHLRVRPALAVAR